MIASRAEHFSCGCDAHLQAQQLDNIARSQWELPHLLLGKWISDRSIHGIDGCRVGLHVHDIGGASDFHAEIQRARCVHLKLHIVSSDCREAGLLNRHLIRSGRGLKKLVNAVFTTQRLPLEAGALIGQRHHGAGNNGAGGIRNQSA